MPSRKKQDLRGPHRTLVTLEFFVDHAGKFPLTSKNDRNFRESVGQEIISQLYDLPVGAVYHVHTEQEDDDYRYRYHRLKIKSKRVPPFSGFVE